MKGGEFMMDSPPFHFAFENDSLPDSVQINYTNIEAAAVVVIVVVVDQEE